MLERVLGMLCFIIIYITTSQHVIFSNKNVKYLFIFFTYFTCFVHVYFIKDVFLYVKSLHV